MKSVKVFAVRQGGFDSNGRMMPKVRYKGRNHTRQISVEELNKYTNEIIMILYPPKWGEEYQDYLEFYFATCIKNNQVDFLPNPKGKTGF